MRDWLASLWPTVQLVLAMIGLGCILGALCVWADRLSTWWRWP